MAMLTRGNLTSSLFRASAVFQYRNTPALLTTGRRHISRTCTVLSTAAQPRLFSDKHEWISVEGKIARVGISQYAQEALGDIVYAQLPDIGAELGQYEECGALESVKAASELYSPASGKVVEKNVELESTPGLINKSCYEKGWLFTMQLKNVDELKHLMDEKKYEAYLKSQAHE